MTSNIWQFIDHIKRDLYDAMTEAELSLPETPIDVDGWSDVVWNSDDFRRAHLSIVDERINRGMMMFHFCVFPHLHSSAPIFGLDIIAGEKKITGAFMDFSPVTTPHQMLRSFKNTVEVIEWKRERAMPEWAKSIFSESIVAAGNITSQDEIQQLMKIIEVCLRSYLSDIRNYNNSADPKIVKEIHNRYAYQQKQNPRLFSSLKSFGLSDDEVTSFVNNCLFPEV